MRVQWRSACTWLPHTMLWLFFASAIIHQYVLPGFNNPRFGIDQRDRSILDFSSHLNFVQRAWTRQTVVGTPDSHSIYSVRNHLKVTSDWAGLPMQLALPFGYSPTMLWLLGPLSILPAIWAYVVWTVLGLICIWWLTKPGKTPYGIGILVFLNPLAIGAFFLGQTVLLSMSGILALSRLAVLRRAPEVDANISRREIFAAIILWALTAKPPLALACGMVLACMGRWKILGLAAVLVLVTILALTPWLGLGWAADYFGMIAHYNRGEADPAFAWSLVPAHMANLRALLNVNIGVRDFIASRASLVIWAVALASLFIYSRRFRVSPGACWSLAILSYLCLCPHVTSTEELHIYLLMPLAFQSNPRINLVGWGLIFGLILLPHFSPAFHSSAAMRTAFFIGKLALIPVALYRMATPSCVGGFQTKM